MYAVHIVRCLNQSFSRKVKTVVSSLKYIQRNYQAKEPSSFDLKSHVKNDVVLFKHEKPSYFILVNVFGLVHCAFWTYLGLFLFRSLDNPALKFDSDKNWGKVLEKEREYSRGLSVFSIFFGWACLLGTICYSLRSIRRIILHKDGRYITLVTYCLPGYNTIKIPLNNISAMEHRSRAKKYIPVKLKNRYFYYLIDVTGEFSNPTLFDFTAGVKRGF